jgi:hypothetical protein
VRYKRSARIKLPKCADVGNEATSSGESPIQRLNRLRTAQAAVSVLPISETLPLLRLLALARLF